MRFFIDKQARKAYLFADTSIEESQLKIIFAHLSPPMPNTVKYFEAQREQGFQQVAAHIEFKDSSAQFGAK